MTPQVEGIVGRATAKTAGHWVAGTLVTPSEVADAAFESDRGERKSQDNGLTTCTTLELLHAFRLSRVGETIELPTPAQRLLAYLALRERPVNRVLVAGSLWLESAEDRAFGSLRSALWSLRHSCPELVESTRQQLRLAPGVLVDVGEAVAWAHDAITTSTEVTKSDFEAALAFGELLPDWYEDWVLLERERLRQLSAHALESLCARLAAAGRHSDALELALLAVDREPLRESTHRIVIKAHIAEGNSSEALRHYDLFRRLLADRLGLPPSDQMETLIHPLQV
jgi:DNA-binding SARP family transcriptional activator